MSTENKLWLPPLPPEDQKKLARLRKKPFLERTGFSSKTLWDWLQLFGILAIPVVVALASIFYSSQQNQASFQIATDQQQETALENYLAKISDLLINDHLKDPQLGIEARSLARAQTLTVLQRLDPLRKGSVVRFLYEAGLINRGNAIVDLHRADLSAAEMTSYQITITSSITASVLNNAILHDADLSGSDMIAVDLSFADLTGADISGALLVRGQLHDADLRGANLAYDDLSNADLSNANLSGADLSHAMVTSMQLAKVFSLAGAIMPDGSIHP